MESTLSTMAKTAPLPSDGMDQKAPATLSSRILTRPYFMSSERMYLLPMGLWMSVPTKIQKCSNKSTKPSSRSSCVREQNKFIQLGTHSCPSQPPSTRSILSGCSFLTQATTSLTKYTSPQPTNSSSALPSVNLFQKLKAQTLSVRLPSSTT